MTPDPVHRRRFESSASCLAVLCIDLALSAAIIACALALYLLMGAR